jgi:regulator of replication initiation timing
MEELQKKLEILQNEIEKLKTDNSRFKKETLALRSENTQLKKQMGIRQYLKTTSDQTSPGAAMEVNQPPSETNHTHLPSTTVLKKPPPFFISGIKSMAKFQQKVSLHMK